MAENTAPNAAYGAPLGSIFNGRKLAIAGQRVYADGRAKTPNNDTIYFRS